MSRVFSAYPIKSLRSGFWITLLGPRPDEPVIDYTANLTYENIILSNFVKILDNHKSIVKHLPKVVITFVLLV